MTLRRWLFSACLLGCGKTEDIGSGLDGVAGAPEMAAATGGAGGAGAACAPTPGFEVVTYERLDRSEWWPEDRCDELALEIQDGVGKLPPIQPIAEELGGTWLDGEGDSRIELALDPTGRGTLTFGEPTPESELDVAGGYLSGFEEVDTQAIDSVNRARQPLPGFTYYARATAAFEGETRVTIELAQPWSRWCPLQQPIRRSDCYGCEFSADSVEVGPWCGDDLACFVSQSNLHVSVHCGRLALCAGTNAVCSCTRHFCTYSHVPIASYLVIIDTDDPKRLRFAEDQLLPNARYLTRGPAEE